VLEIELIESFGGAIESMLCASDRTRCTPRVATRRRVTRSMAISRRRRQVPAKPRATSRSHTRSIASRGDAAAVEGSRRAQTNAIPARTRLPGIARIWR
jgi:hypothetical protein